MAPCRKRFPVRVKEEGTKGRERACASSALGMQPCPPLSNVAFEYNVNLLQYSPVKPHTLTPTRFSPRQNVGASSAASFRAITRRIEIRGAPSPPIPLYFSLQSFRSLLLWFSREIESRAAHIWSRPVGSRVSARVLRFGARFDAAQTVTVFTPFRCAGRQRARVTAQSI